jgi:hypothetical protein
MVKAPSPTPDFQRSDLGQPTSMALLTGESGGEESPGQVFGKSGPDDTGAQAQDVDVIVFDHLMRRVGVVGDGRPDAPDLVGGDAGPRPRTANEDRSDRLPVEDRLSSGDGCVRIVDRVGVVGSEIEHGVALVGEEFGQMLLQLVPGVIGGDSYPHG